MAPPQTKREKAVAAMNLQNGCTEISVPSSWAQESSAVPALTAVFQRTKSVEVHHLRLAFAAKKVNSLCFDEIS
jgi:hypothetical protein